MRRVTDHIVENDPVNHQLRIEVLDEPGAGGANHRYLISGFELVTNPSSAGSDSVAGAIVLFQNGAIKEVGVNGVTHEALLAIVIDRLRSFQTGPFAGRENAIALTHFEEGLMWLQRRTRARIARGVEGTQQR